VATQIVGRMSTEHGGLSAFTPAYGAPEQWLPKRFGQTGTWTDVWGFALCAVEALTGRAPLDGDAHAVMGACIDEQRRPTPRNSGASVPDVVEAAFERALAVDPKRRYRDIGEFWDAVESAVGVRTPRIAVEGQVVSDSVAPPAEPGVVPDLTVPVPARVPKKIAESAPDFSLVRNDALELDPAAARVRSERRPKAEFELDSTGPRPSVRQPRPRSPRALAPVPGVDPRATEHLLLRLRPSLMVLLVGVGLTIGDFAFAAISGAPFTLGPVRVFWISAPLVVLGLFRLVHALLSA
jgi:serine/threonine-protein kinase